MRAHQFQNVFNWMVAPEFRRMCLAISAKKRRGRPATTGAGTQIGERWHDPELAAIDAWIVSTGKTMTRAQAVRRMVELGLKAKGK